MNIRRFCNLKSFVTLLILFILVTLSSCVTPVHQLRTNMRCYLVQPDGRQRSYLLHLPSDYSPEKEYPVVVVFHGAIWNAVNARLTSGFDELVDREQVIAVYPESTVGFPELYKQWNAFHCCGSAVKNHVDDIGFTKMVLEDLKARCSVDSDRVYMAGWSNGGMFAFFYAALFPEDVAGVGGIGAAVASRVVGENTFWTLPTPKQPVPAVILHGEKDDIVHYDHGYPYPFNAQREYLPVRHTVEYWVRGNRCLYTAAGLPDQTNPVLPQRWQNPSGQTMVAFYSFEDWKHNWMSPFFTSFRPKTDPLHGFSAAEAMWEFWQKCQEESNLPTLAKDLDSPQSETASP